MALLLLVIIISISTILVADIDEDELPTYLELTVGTNPILSDTDLDELPDGFEYLHGLDPLADWRRSDLKSAIRGGLCDIYLRSCKSLVLKLKGTTKVETVWNILKWIDEKIEYNKTKAKEEDRRYQSPEETLRLRKGICTDYALLTSALLICAGVKPIYVLDIDLEYEDHVAAAVMVGNELYVLDQHLPPIPLSIYISRSKRILQDTIKSIRIYKVDKNNDTVSVNEVSVNTEVKKPPLDELRKCLITEFLKMYKHYNLDPRLRNYALKIAKKFYDKLPPLPSRYEEGVVIGYTLPVEYCPSAFIHLISSWIIQNMLKGYEDDLRKYQYFYLHIEDMIDENGNILIILIVAK